MTTRTDRPTRRPRGPEPRPKLDPRIRKRRIEVTREQGRRRLRFLVVVVVIGIVAGAAWLLLHSALLDVNRVVVRGAEQVSARDVLSAAGVDEGDALVFVDLGRVERRVERLPRVDEARADRHLPGELEIRVTERSPAFWARRTEAAVALVDDRGRVLVDAPGAPPDLPELVGLAAVPAPGGRVGPIAIGRVLPAMPDELRHEVARLSVDGAELTLGLRAGPEIRLGPGTALEEKGRVALAILRTLDEPFPAYVDVGAPAAPAIG